MFERARQIGAVEKIVLLVASSLLDVAGVDVCELEEVQALLDAPQNHRRCQRYGANDCEARQEAERDLHADAEARAVQERMLSSLLRVELYRCRYYRLAHRDHLGYVA